METVTDFIFLGSKITADGDCKHEIKRRLFLGRKAMTNIDSILKTRDITFPTKVHLVKATVFPVVMYGSESWTIKKAEHLRIDAFELWCWRRLLRVPWTARRSNQSILKEISPEYSLEGLMLNLKLQYLGHLMRRTDSMEKTLMLGKTEGRRRRGWQRMRLLDGITTRWTWVWASSRSWWWTGEPGMLQSMGSQRVGHDWAPELQGCILSPCLFNLYAEYIMRNAGLEEAQAGIKIAGRNINHLRYADDTTLMAESEEELKSFLMKVEDEGEKVGLKLTFIKLRSWHLAPSLHGK